MAETTDQVELTETTSDGLAGGDIWLMGRCGAPHEYTLVNCVAHPAGQFTI